MSIYAVENEDGESDFTTFILLRKKMTKTLDISNCGFLGRENKTFSLFLKVRLDNFVGCNGKIQEKVQDKQWTNI